jgi:LPXTG-motif cell wall-anchored protein
VAGLESGDSADARRRLVNVANTTGTGQTAFGGLSGYFPWIALGVVVLAGGGYLLMRRRNEDDDFEET